MSPNRLEQGVPSSENSSRAGVSMLFQVVAHDVGQDGQALRTLARGCAKRTCQPCQTRKPGIEAAHGVMHLSAMVHMNGKVTLKQARQQFARLGFVDRRG